MNNPHKKGQANTEYSVIIGLIAVGLIVAVSVVALVIKWNYSRTTDALAGQQEATSDDVARKNQRVEDEIARAHRTRVNLGGFSEDDEVSGKGGTVEEEFVASGRPDGVYHGSKPLHAPEPEVVTASSLRSGQGSATFSSFDYDSSGVETSEFGAYRSSGGPGKGKSISRKSVSRPLGLPWIFWIFLFLLLLLFFFMWATADP